MERNHVLHLRRLPLSTARASLSNSTTAVAAVIAAMTFSASGSAPTPLYHQYAESFGLSPFMLTVIFAAYVLSLLFALLRRLAVGLYRPASRDHRGAVAEHRRHGDVHGRRIPLLL